MHNVQLHDHLKTFQSMLKIQIVQCKLNLNLHVQCFICTLWCLRVESSMTSFRRVFQNIVFY